MDTMEFVQKCNTRLKSCFFHVGREGLDSFEMNCAWLIVNTAWASTKYLRAQQMSKDGCQRKHIRALNSNTCQRMSTHFNACQGRCVDTHHQCGKLAIGAPPLTCMRMPTVSRQCDLRCDPGQARCSRHHQGI